MTARDANPMTYPGFVSIIFKKTVAKSPLNTQFVAIDIEVPVADRFIGYTSVAAVQMLPPSPIE